MDEARFSAEEYYIDHVDEPSSTSNVNNSHSDNDPLADVQVAPMEDDPGMYSKCINAIATPKFVLTFLCIGTMSQGMLVNGLVPVSITTLEKRFHLSSTQSGAFASMYDIAVCLSLIPVCHYGSKGNKARWVGVGFMLTSAGAIVCSLAQFLSDKYDLYEHDVTNTCPSHYDDCSEVKQSLDARAYILLMAGQFLNGVGGSPLFTLGVTYLDENVSQRSFPLYLGIFLGTSVFGPALGYVLGGLFLRIYGDIGRVDLTQIKIDPSSPLWYGAWWLGFLVVSFVTLLISIPMMFLPKQLPGAAEHRKNDIDQSYSDSDADDRTMHPSFGENISDFFYTCGQLARNPTFIFLVAVDCIEAFADQGVIDFMPKIIEHWFSVSPSTASLYTGAVAIPSGFLGNVIGGAIIRHFHLKCAAMILFAGCVNFACFGFMNCFLATCNKPNFAGVTARYDLRNDNNIGGIINSCNANCQCSKAIYDPVCLRMGPTQLSYYSECFAGCPNRPVSGQFFNCSCVGLIENITAADYTLKSGICESSDCAMMPVFLIFLGCLVFFSFMTSIPIQTAELRCIPFKHRTIAFGVRSLLFRLLGTIPGPVVFGKIIDLNCSLWKYRCSHKEECVMYQNSVLSKLMAGIGMLVKFLIIVCLFSGWHLYKRSQGRQKLADKDDTIKSTTSTINALTNSNDKNRNESKSQTVIYTVKPALGAARDPDDLPSNNFGLAKLASVETLNSVHSESGENVSVDNVSSTELITRY